MMNPRCTRISLATTVAIALAAPSAAHAFCGFYVSGAGADMFNNATQVVLMREGTRTVLSMQNNYQGPPENFAMVVPVPEVLSEETVKTLDKKIFDRVDQLAAPRLVEYWEQDPCMVREYEKLEDMADRSVRMSSAVDEGAAGPLGVTIEAQFKVGEYQIVILSARDSTGLDTWLRQEKYQIPEGAEPLLRPYVQGGSKFFVAKVDTAKVKFVDGMAMLSPLRFHYDTETFTLPVRLGMINSAGTQDLIVHVLAKGKRYQVANYKNVTIPTNLDVNDEVRTRFGEFYAALFDATLEKNPGAVITEYSWDASSCDPCPTPALSPSELATLGEDVLYAPPIGGATAGADTQAAKAIAPRRRWSGFVLTRIHARYGKDALSDDLVFEEAPAIAGGREFLGGDGIAEQGVQPSTINNFQARYAIRHEWTGPIECKNPQRGIWGGPPPGVKGTSQPKPALDLAFAPRGQAKLGSFVRRDIPELGVSAQAEPSAGETPKSENTGATTGAASDDKPQKTTKKKSKGCAATDARATSGFLALLILALALAIRRRRDPGHPDTATR